MSRFVLTTEAKSDLREIHEFIRRDSPEAARRVVEEIRAAMRKLAANPGIGHLREDLAPGPVRFWLVYSYLIIYRPTPKPIRILRVMHGARDLASELSRGGLPA